MVFIIFWLRLSVWYVSPTEKVSIAAQQWAPNITRYSNKNAQMVKEQKNNSLHTQETKIWEKSQKNYVKSFCNHNHYKGNQENAKNVGLVEDLL